MEMNKEITAWFHCRTLSLFTSDKGGPNQTAGGFMSMLQ